MLHLHGSAQQALITIQEGGVVALQPGAVLYADGAMTLADNAALHNEGTVTLHNALLTNRGRYTGTGMLDAGPSTNEGSVAPGSPTGNSTGCLSFNSSFANDNTLALDIKSAIDFDKIALTGTTAKATAGGTLAVNFGTYVPPSGQRFHIIRAAAYDGIFADISITPNTINANYNDGFLTIYTALPVELLALTAQKAGEAVQLRWRTASETNNQGFELQRSADGQQWEAIHFANGQGTTTVAHDYEHLDQNPLAGFNYYRLRQVDFSGKEQFSNIVSIAMYRQNAFQVYPNPVSGSSLKLYWSGTAEADVTATLFNAAGQPVRTMAVSNGINTLTVHDLPSGLYTLQAINGREIHWAKVLVQE